MNNIQIAKALINELPFTKGHITCRKWLKTESITVEFKGHTSRSNFDNIQKYLESFNYFNKVEYHYSEALNGKGNVYAKKKITGVVTPSEEITL